MKKIKIAVDVDNVLSDFTTMFVKDFKKRTGLDLKKEDLTDWNYTECIKKIYKDFDENVSKEIIRNEENIKNLKMIEGAEESFKEICKNPNVEVRIITAVTPSLHKTRREWLERYFEKEEYELFFEYKKEKIEFDYIIDDALHNLNGAATKIPIENCICIEHLYNKNDIYPTFKSLKAAIDYIIKKENLA